MIAMLLVRVLVAAAIGAGLIGACRWIHRRSTLCALVVAAGALLHSALTLILFWTSYLNPPFLRRMQSGDGFWSLAVDARIYYHLAAGAARDGIAGLPRSTPSSAFVKTLAAWIRLVGESPMSGGYLNLVLLVLLSLIIVAVFRPTGERRTDLPCLVMLAALWFSPALLIYGSQPLKDTLFVGLIGLMCAAAWVFLPSLIANDTAPRRPALALGMAVVCIAALYVIAGIRGYYTALAWSALALALALFAWRARAHAARFLVLSVLLLTAGWLAYVNGVDPDYYINPYAPLVRKVLGPLASPESGKSPVTASVWVFVDHYRTGFVLTPGATNVKALKTSAKSPGKAPVTPSAAAVAPAPAPAPPALPVEDSGPGLVTRKVDRPRDNLAERLSALGLGLGLIFVPVSALRAVSIVDFGGGRGLLAITDADTLFMDLTMAAVLVLLVRRRRDVGAQWPYVTFCVALALAAALLMGYIVTNFGTLFRLRLMVAAPIWMLPLALSTRLTKRESAAALAAGGLPGGDRSHTVGAGALVRSELLEVLACPACGRQLRMDGAGEALRCSNCDLAAPITDGIPRFVGSLRGRRDDPAASVAARTQASFGYEWTHFHDWHDSGETSFRDYFETADISGARNGRVLDAGCGMGRHARQMAAHARQVVAVDFSRAIDQAARNTSAAGNVDCVQADLLRLPFADRTFEYIYSFGVLHHLVDTETALRGLVAKLKPGGRLRVYLYWKRHGAAGVLLRVVNAVRPLTTRLPFWLLRCLCWGLSIALWPIVVLPYKLLLAAGVRGRKSWPLLVYARYPFRVLYNDQFDRFSAPLEKRYDPEDVAALLASAGLRDVRVDACFGWVAEGVKPVGPDPCAG